MAPAMKRPAAAQPDAKAKAANGDSNEVVRWLHREAKESFWFPISTMNLESTSIIINLHCSTGLNLGIFVLQFRI
jgi:hypothetical protein